MTISLCFSPCFSIKPSNQPGLGFDKTLTLEVIRVNEVFRSSRTSKLHSVVVKAAESNQSAKTNSILCGVCDGNGAVKCSQCEGTGVNSVDHFNGQFKAGESCWLCGGKREMLCGNCNGAGFLGGFLSTTDQ